ncbi:IS5 family transposase [Kovacikia minuta CCNUW1]|nr:IS5 family transposase [Kovacikia minuta CCNUW1]
MHLRCEGNGLPVTFRLTVGQRNESVVFESLMEQGDVKRVGRGRPRLRPDRVAGDKASTGKPIRTYLQRRGIGAVIPRRSNESRRGTRFNRQAYRERHRIERTINRFKQFRRIATRYKKRAENYLAMLTVASILLWL